MKGVDIGGTLGIVCGALLIGLAIWVSKSAMPLWAIILLLMFARDYPWSAVMEAELEAAETPDRE